MYWCVAKNGSINEDNESKYLETQKGWSFKNVSKTRTFELNQLSGCIAKIQGVRDGFCTVKINELEYLKQLINGKESKEYKELFDSREKLKSALIIAIRNLNSKDFEILIDLIFRNFGWRRKSVLGETMKFFDLELEEPLTKALHGVQIKARSTLTEYNEYRNSFLMDYKNEFSSFFFVVNSPDKKLEDYVEEDEDIKILKSHEIADFAIDGGLITWIMDKSK
jgi:hypothetical protein